MQRLLFCLFFVFYLFVQVQSVSGNTYSESFTISFDSLKKASSADNLTFDTKLVLKRQLLSFCNNELNLVSKKMEKISPASEKSSLKSSNKLWVKYFNNEVSLAKKIFTRDKLNSFADLYIIDRQINLLQLRVLDLYELIGFYSR